MTSTDLRKKFLDFFKSKNHTILSSASLIPEHDPTVLFTTAGMHPLVPFLLGEKHPGGKRLANVQVCFRTSDIDEIGDAVHHTLFEMLGNWSLGDYFKEDAIKYSFEFLTKELNIPLEKLAVSCFAGDDDAPKDEESAKIWESLGVKKERIAFLPKEDNWWGPAGKTGPCGPDTEMFYWTGKEKAPEKFISGDKRWVEVWNNVFMEYFKNEVGKYEPLSQKNVDTGMGFERALAVLNGFDDNYLTDVFSPVVKKIEELSGKKYENNKKEFRIIADHIKAATFIIGDERGAEPSNVGQGYIVRRLIRRAVKHGKQLGVEGIFTFKTAEEIIKIYQDAYPELKKKKDFIINQLVKEEEKFKETLEKGLKEFKLQIVNCKTKEVSGKTAFNLYQSYGFPLEFTEELAEENGFSVDKEGFKKELEKHQELSRTASAGMFRGGLADSEERTIKYHTANHLLLAALRQVLGRHVVQKGSNITAERLRFDFFHPQKMMEEEIKKVEEIVNKKIKEDLEVMCEEMTMGEAKNKEAIGVFESKYGEKIKVYTIGEFSKEICGGPHANKTSELGGFKIIKEESSSSGVRRIKAVLKKI